MKFILSLTISLLISFTTVDVLAQISSTKQAPKVMSLDSLRKREDNTKDSIVYTSKYIRYTLAELLKDSIQTITLDTTISNFQNYSPISQPQNPTIGLGTVGLDYRDLLFNPSKTIGFDAGFHSLDRYMLTTDSVRYYRAQSPYTELYYVDGKLKMEILRVIHSQNITPNWNVGGNYNRIVGAGFYQNQNVNHINASFFTWFQSRNKRYMALSTAVFNNITADENGSIINNDIFIGDATPDRLLEPVRLSGQGANTPKQTWKSQSIFLKQFYYLGKQDSMENKKHVLPTQRISHMFSYSNNEYRFFRSEPDLYGAFPDIPSSINITTTNDSTFVQKLSNELAYSFYLRGKSTQLLKNEVKLDLGVQHDWYIYDQADYELIFNNITLKAAIGYRFNDRAGIHIDLQQIAEGKNVGDFLYDAKARFLLSRSAGQIKLGAYSQSKSPEQLFERVEYQFEQWNLNFNKTRIHNLSFLYENPKFSLTAKAEYFLISNYLYYQETIIPQQIAPQQLDNTINMLKFSLAKNFKLGRFHLDNYIVYQKSSYQNILRTPDIYMYNSLYYQYRLFKVLLANTGFDVRYNSRFEAPSYAINVSQFYNNTKAIIYDSFPVIDFWIRANLKRVNFFFKYEYINQGMFQEGFYTVNQYPMQDGAFRMGISWRFYN
mgnify:CR=1 FL=1